MGCSASRLDSLLAKAIEDPSYLSSCTSSSSSSCSTKSSAIPKSRSFSAPMVHHPALREGDSNHLVCLTSSTYGSLIVVDKHPSPAASVDFSDGFSGESLLQESVINTWELMEGLEGVDGFNPDSGNGFKLSSFNSCDFDDAQKKTYSKLGLDITDGDNLKKVCDFSDAQKNLSGFKLSSFNSCDFDDAHKKPTSKLGLDMTDSCDNLKKDCDFSDAQKECKKKLSDSYVFVEMPREIVEEGKLNLVSKSKPLWKYLSEESLLSKMDPIVVSSYQNALLTRKLGYDQPRRMTKSVSSIPLTTKSKSVDSSPIVSKLSNDNASRLSCMETKTGMGTQSGTETGTENINFPKFQGGFGCRDFPHYQNMDVSGTGNDNCLKLPCIVASRLPGSEDKIVLYFTSLRGIRRTYEDCCSIRMILRGFRVMVDERDISMDSNYRKELQSALNRKVASLPQLFIRGRHIGGAEEIKQLHETGEFERFLDGFPIQDHGFVCERCGESRFVPCSNCNGSRKVFQEEEGRTRRCLECNENGLVRCPGCCL